MKKLYISCPKITIQYQRGTKGQMLANGQGSYIKSI